MPADVQQTVFAVEAPSAPPARRPETAGVEKPARPAGEPPARPLANAGGGTRTLLSVQYARAVAAVGVLMFHAFNDANATAYPEQVLQAGVDLFFVISGFIMWVTTFKSDIGPKGFFGKRVRRIVPLYWLFSAIAVLTAVVAPQLGKSTGAEHAIASFLFLPAVNPVTHKAEPLLAPGWTLNHEMLFYVIFALALTLPSRKRRLMAVIGLNVLLVVVGLLTHGPLLVSFYTNPIILEFIFGVIVGWIYTSGYSASRRVSGVMVTAGALTMVLFAAAWGQTVILRVLVWGIPAAVIVLGLALTENAKPVARWRSGQFLGDASYSIYIVHGVMLAALFSIVHHLGAPDAVMIPVGVPVALIGGLIVYRYIERPMTNYLGRHRRARAPITAPPVSAPPLVRAEVAGTVDR
jgi:exopolysaccharide production protein ExoZ